MPTNSKTHILLIDDDPVFRATVAQRARQRNIEVTVCKSLSDVDPDAHAKLYNVAIVDYYLDDLKTYLKGTDVANALESTPILLISSTDAAINSDAVWASSIRKFINKKKGVDVILDEAVKLTHSADSKHSARL